MNAFRGRKLDLWILGIFSFLFLLQAVLSIRNKSATFDEVMRQLPGYVALEFGDQSFHPEKPPLIKMLAAVPLLFMDIRLPPFPDRWSDEARWRVAQDFLYKVNDADRLVFWGRVAVLPIALLLGWSVFYWSKQLFGRTAAVFALFLYVFEPNILGHSPLMNMDLALACFGFLTVYGFHKLLDRVSIGRVLFTGLAFGLALVTSFTAVSLVPILLVLWVTDRLFCGIRSDRKTFPSAPVEVVSRTTVPKTLVALALVGLIGYTIVWGFYGFRFGAGRFPIQPMATAESADLPVWAPVANRLEVWSREIKLLPEAYLNGLFGGLQSTRREAFLLGELSNGWFHYFVVTFALKAPLAFLLLIAAALVVLFQMRERRRAVFHMIVFVVAYFGIVSFNRLNIGHRHLLPVYPFLFVLASAVIPPLLRCAVPARCVFALLPLWYLVSSLSVFPHYLSYFNEIAGGPDRGYKYLVDSNIDWGQDLKGLGAFMRENRIERVWLSYFGTASPEYYGIRYNYLPSYVVFGPRPEKHPTPYVAISATMLQGVYLKSVLGINPDYFRELRNRRPIAKIGYSIFIYELGEPAETLAQAIPRSDADGPARSR